MRIKDTHTVALNISTLFAQTIATTIMIAPKNRTNRLLIWHHLVLLCIPTCEQLIGFLLYATRDRWSVTIVLYAHCHVFQCTFKTIIMYRYVYHVNTFLYLILMVRIPPQSSTTFHGSSVSAQLSFRCVRPCNCHSQQSNAPCRLGCHSDENHQVIHI